ncbi:MAG: D-alanyl-D-alanine carboxypeptidase/D-alanyl-D-alanine-endopeptidase [Ignavibacteriae bacterium]|nr:D-alanyl-D-alanine carboxypeptidase/D-alanyl-D-alanine-endopeptidase [Ignavibacteriota bacterium]
MKCHTWYHYLVSAGFALLLAGCATTRQQQQPPRPDVESEPLFEKPSMLTTLSASPYAMLKAKIDSLIPDSLFPPAHIGIKIASLKTKETLYELNANSLFNPASNQKLYTSSTALSRLGPSYELATVVSIDTLTNTIFIKGYGDGVFSTENLDSLARAVKARLPFGRTWRVAGDVSYFDSEFWGYGWNWDDEPEAYQMFLTPLILNGNTIRLIAKPGLRVGDSVLAFTRPATNFVSILNNATTAADTDTVALKLSRKWRERSNVLTVEGGMRLSDKADSTDLSVWQPERYTVQVFAERMKQYGAIIHETAIDTVSPSAFEVARFSHKLDTVMTYLNKESDNLSAETFLKVLAAEKKGTPGSAETGVTVVKEFLAEHDIDTTKIRIVDGSGLSRMNLISPAATVRLLEAMYGSPHFMTFYRSLPIAGFDGTIRSRMRRTPAAGNLHAKTGTLSGVTALSGYVKGADDEWFAFSMMMMNYPTQARVYRRVQDRIGVFLSRLSREAF